MEEFLRDTWQTSLVLLSLLLLTRLSGNTQIGQLTFYEYVSGITIGSVAATVIASEPDRIWSHFYDLVLFCALTYIISLATLKNRAFRKLIQGSPIIVIQNGKILEGNMRTIRFDLDELVGQLREKGIFDVSEVQYAAIETSGGLSVIKKSVNQPLTKGDYGLQPSEATIPVELILDGEIISDNLKGNRISEDWLNQQLSQQMIDSPSQVTYAVIDSKGQLFVSKKTSMENESSANQ